MDIPLDAQAKIDEAEAELEVLQNDRGFIGDFVARSRYDELISNAGDYIRSLKNPYEPRTVEPREASDWTPESKADKAKRVAIVVQRALKQEKEGRI